MRPLDRLGRLDNAKQAEGLLPKMLKMMKKRDRELESMNSACLPQPNRTYSVSSNQFT
jgi:hypothetical protein